MKGRSNEGGGGEGYGRGGERERVRGRLSERVRKEENFGKRGEEEEEGRKDRVNMK